MIRLRNTRSFRNPHRKKFPKVRSGDRTGQAMSPKLRTQVTRCCTFLRSITTDHMKWRPLLYRSPSRQPRQAIASAQCSNLKCVSRLRATLYMLLKKTCLRHRRKIVYLVCFVSTEVVILSKATEYLVQRMTRPSRDSTVLRLTVCHLTVRHDT